MTPSSPISTAPPPVEIRNEGPWGWGWAAAGSVVTAGWVMACATGRPADAVVRAAAAATAALVTAALGAARPRLTSPRTAALEPTEPADALATAALGAARPAPTSPRSAAAAALALTALPLFIQRPETFVLALVPLVVLALADRTGLDHAVAPAGFVLVAVGVLIAGGNGHHWPIEPSQGVAVLIIVGTLVVLAGLTLNGTSTRKPGLLVLAPAMLAAASAAPVLPHLELAIAAALAALALALFGNEPAALAAMSLGPLAVAAARPAGLLLAAAAVLAAAVPRREALLAALPGAVALTATLADHRLTGVNAALAAGLVATAALIAWHPRPAPPAPIRMAHAGAVALLAWLVLLPRTWQWTGSQRLAEYQRGAAVAAEGAAFAAIAVLAWNLRHARRQEARPEGEEEAAAESLEGGEDR
jgi:hypothetical protein